MKIGICVPVHSTTKAAFTLSLSRMLMATMKLPATAAFGRIDIEIFMVSSSNLPRSRKLLVEAARKWGADKLLWLDSDQTFPPDTLIRLLARHKEVVAVNSIRRLEGGQGPSATYENKQMCFTTIEKRDAQLVEEVGHTGFSVVLMDATLFDRIERPWFAFVERADGTDQGEDSYLFEKLRGAGVTIWVDHSLSWQIGHVSEEMLTHEGAFQGALRRLIKQSGAQA